MVRATKRAQLPIQSPASRGTGALRIGILLVEMPRMLHDVVDTILGVEPDVRVVADGVRPDMLTEHVERERPDVVVLAVESGSTPPVCEELLGRFPRLAVVALEDGGKGATIYTMRPMRFRLAEISRIQLVAAIRRAAGRVPFLARAYDASLNVANVTNASGTQE